MVVICPLSTAEASQGSVFLKRKGSETDVTSEESLFEAGTPSKSGPGHMAEISAGPFTLNQTRTPGWTLPGTHILPLRIVETDAEKIWPGPNDVGYMGGNQFGTAASRRTTDDEDGRW